MSRPRRSTWAALVLCLALAGLGAGSVSLESSMGWDEAMHNAWPAARLRLALGEGNVSGFFGALLDCEQYPFVGPLWTAGVWCLTGISEAAARGGARVLWAIGLFGVFLLAGEASRGRRGEALAPWIALAFAMASPLAMAFSGTLFLEIPSTVVLIFTLHAWLRRSQGGASRELIAGAWITLLFFTKFNYALLTGAGFALDVLYQGVRAGRAGEARAFLRRTAVLASLPLLGAAWWFGLPLPEGLARGAAHRHAFAVWIAGNTGLAPTPGALRALHWGTFLVWAPRVLLLLGVGVLAGLLRGDHRRGISLGLVAAVSIALVSTHPFHLERFLLPLAVPLWVLAGVGWASLVPQEPRRAGAALSGLFVLGFAFPNADASWLLERVGMRNDAARDYQQTVLDNWRNLSPARDLPTNGLAREEVDALIAVIGAEWDGQQRMGWCGVSAKLSPGAVLLGLLEQGRPVEAALQDPNLDRSFMDLGHADPEWDDARILAWAEDFDLLFASRPHDIGGTPQRGWVEDYQRVLAASGAWTYAKLGGTSVARPNGDPEAVELLVLRRLP